MKIISIIIGVAAALAASPALASPEAISGVVAVATSAPTASPFASGSPVSARELGAITGQADTAMAVRAQNTSTVSNNSVSGQSQTGTISFDSQAFQSLNGLALLSANTGNNVSINASLNVNIAIQP